MEGLVIAVEVGTAVVVGNALAPKLRLPMPSAQVPLGFALAFVPDLESLRMPPEVVPLLFLPGLSLWESFTTSENAIRRDLCGILITSAVLVVATALAVAWIASSPGIPWEAALVLGAVAVPFDTAAAAALAKGLPHRQFMLSKAEGLTNDGTALVVYTITVGLTLGGQYTPWDITRMAVVSFFGRASTGIATAAVAYPAFRRLHESITINVALLVTPYTAYLAAELVRIFGVLATIVTGPTVSTLSNQLGIPEPRAQAEYFWSLATNLLNDALFLLVGIEVRLLVANFGFSELLILAGIAVGVAVVLTVSRFMFPQITVMIIRTLDRRPEQRQRCLGYRARVISVISAFRGGVSLMIALSTPLTMKDGSPLPYRDEAVLVAAFAIAIRIAVQGPLLPKVIAWVAKGGHINDDEEAELTEEQLITER